MFKNKPGTFTLKMMKLLESTSNKITKICQQ